MTEHTRGPPELTHKCEERVLGDLAIVAELVEGLGKCVRLSLQRVLQAPLGDPDVCRNERVDHHVQQEDLREQEEEGPQEAGRAVLDEGGHEDVDVPLGGAGDEKVVNRGPEGAEALVHGHGLPLARQHVGGAVHVLEDGDHDPGEEDHRADEEDRHGGELPHHPPVEDERREALGPRQEAEEPGPEDEGEADGRLEEGEDRRVQDAPQGEGAAQDDVPAAVVLQGVRVEVVALVEVLQEELPQDHELDAELQDEGVARGQVPDAREVEVAPRGRGGAPLRAGHPGPEGVDAVHLVAPGRDLHEGEEHEADNRPVVRARRGQGPEVLLPGGVDVPGVLLQPLVVDRVLDLPGRRASLLAAVRERALELVREALLVRLLELLLEGLLHLHVAVDLHAPPREVLLQLVHERGERQEFFAFRLSM
mmetsp:Transcript_87598/g.248364  ORF Transcript_87598/g.248364 Transcript_87598/m.248364 type:complete len:422 (+) Transcript_87598:1340-2605(+)